MQFGVSRQDSRDPIVPASVFTMLQRGGGKDLCSEAIIFHAGRHWHSLNGPKNYLVHGFKQRPLEKEQDNETNSR